MGKRRGNKNRKGKPVHKSGSSGRGTGGIMPKLLLVLLGIMLIGCVELVVRVLPLDNAIQPTEDPFVGFSDVHPLFVPAGAEDGRTMMETAQNKRRWFNEQRFPRTKDPGTVRVFNLGGSTTYGRPYADQTSFGGWLRTLLEKASDGTRSYEVINAGGVSYASYRVVNVLRELLDYEPDLFVVYTGHNEFLEARTYGEFYEQQGSFWTGVRQSLSRLETYRLLDGLYRGTGESDRNNKGANNAGGGTVLGAEVETILDRSAGLDLYHRDSTFSNGVFEHYDYNIGLIKRLCREAGVPVLFLEPVDNLKDFSPFKSEENPRLDSRQRQRLASALAQGMSLLAEGMVNKGTRLLREAVAVDSLYAAAHFYLGRALLESGDTAAAAERFLAARELDVCPLRAQQPIHDILLRHTSGTDDPDLIRLPLLFASLSPGGIVGGETLIDHIHPYPQGHLLIAVEVLGWMREEGFVDESFQPSDSEMQIMYRDVMASLPEEYYNKGLLNLTKVLHWAGKYQEALTVLNSQWDILQDVAQAQYLVGTIMERMGNPQAALVHLNKALELEPDHLMVLSMLARVYTNLGMTDSAVVAYDKVLQYYPDEPGILTDYGVMLSISGQDEQALRAFEKAQRSDPALPGLNNNIGLIHYMAGRNEQALEAFNRELAINPDDAQAYYNIGTVYARLEQMDKAEENYLEALAHNPELSNARVNLGNIYQNRGELEAAEEQFRMALAVDSQQLGAYVNLARLYLENGRDDEARQVVQTGLRVFPNEQSLIRLIQE